MIGAPEALRIDLVNVFRPGWTRRKPSAFRDHLGPADGRVLARRLDEDGLDCFAGQLCKPYLVAREPRQQLFLLRDGGRFNAILERLTELACQLTIEFAWIATHARGHFRREQRRDHAVLIRRPDAAIQTDERRTRALLSGKAQRAVTQPLHEPLETDRHLVELPAQFRRDAINTGCPWKWGKSDGL